MSVCPCGHVCMSVYMNILFLLVSSGKSHPASHIILELTHNNMHQQLRKVENIHSNTSVCVRACRVVAIVIKKPSSRCDVYNVYVCMSVTVQH